MNNDPRFSVIIPVYNGEKTITRAIESVLEQSTKAHEVIVVNDGSTDATENAIKPYLSDIIYLSQENAGVSTARNNGADKATGEWLAFLDCDDWFYTNRLQRHADIINIDASLEVLFSGYEYIGEDGTLINSSIEASSIGGYFLQKINNAQYIPLSCEDANTFIEDQYTDVRALSVKKELFVKVNGFPKAFTICEDVLLIINLLKSSVSSGITTDICAAYSVHDTGLIRSDTSRAQRETIKALRSIEDEIEKGQCNLKQGWQRLTKKAYLNQAYQFSKSGKRSEAMTAVLNSFIFEPKIRDIKDIISMLKS